MPTVLDFDRLSLLTAEQRQTVDLLLEGQPAKAVAQRMRVSVRTVERRQATACRILGVRSLLEAAALGAMKPRAATLTVAELAFRSSVSGLAVVDRSGTFVGVNPAFCRIVRRPEGELVGREPASILHPDDRDHSADRIRRVMAGDTSSPGAVRRFRRRTGGYVAVHVRARLIRSPDGSPWGLSAEFIPVEELHRRCR